MDEAIEMGWYLSSKLSVSGIPWDMVCPECRWNHPTTGLPDKDLRASYPLNN